MELVIVESRGLTLAFYGISECTFHIRNTLEYHLFKESPIERRTFTCTFEEANNLIKKFDPHWVIIGGDPSLTRQNRGGRRLDLPMNLCVYVDISDKEAALKSLNKRLPGMVKRTIERLSLSMEMSQDDKDFEYFFEAMHKPFMQKRHGIRARSTSKESAYKTLHEGGKGYITKVFSEGKWIAGMAVPVDMKSKTAYCRFMGFLNDDETFYKAGVSMIMYYYILEWSLERKLKLLHLGGTYPFVDGIFKAKKQLGCRLYRPREGFMSELGGYEMGFHFLKDHELIRQFLISKPLIVLDESGELCIMGFYPPGEPFVPDYSNSQLEKIVTQNIDHFMQPVSI